MIIGYLDPREWEGEVRDVGAPWQRSRRLVSTES